jgi:hypothetical protein
MPRLAAEVYLEECTVRGGDECSTQSLIPCTTNVDVIGASVRELRAQGGVRCEPSRLCCKCTHKQVAGMVHILLGVAVWKAATSKADLTLSKVGP